MTMFPHTITVLNKVETDDGVIYLPTILRGVLYATLRSSSRSTTGSDNKDNIKCTIPFGVSVDEDKQYIGSLAFTSLPDNQKHKYWTLTKEDIIVKDEVHTNQISLKTINTMYEEKMVVSSVDKLDFGGLKHWQVGGA